MTENKEHVIKHLEMIQGVITRLAYNSFLLKGWSLTLLAAMLIFMVRTGASAWVILCFLIPILTFWGLDAYYLWQEKLFRRVYDDVRIRNTTDFSMSTCKYKNKEKWCLVAISITLFPFYIMEVFFLLLVFSVLFCEKSSIC